MDFINGIHINELLFIIYIIFYLYAYGWKFRIHETVIQYSLLYIALGCLGIISAVINQSDQKDIFEAFRMFVLASMFVFMVYWAKEYGSNIIIRVWLIGAIIGSIINLFFTFKYQLRLFGILPVLFGQNGPGGFMGLFVGVGSWLMLIKKNMLDLMVALSVLIIGVLTVLLSNSKIGQLLLVFSMICWIGIVVYKRSKRQVVFLSVLVLILLSQFSFINEYISSVDLLTKKVRNEELVDPYKDKLRIQFYGVVFDIVANNPLVGVSYSGFAEEFRSHLIAGEYGKSDYSQSFNPHNSFLYYISSNGLIAIPVMMMIFIGFANSFYLSLKMYGKSGLVVWFCLVIAYILFGNALPSLFKTEIMMLPAAVSFSDIIYKNIIGLIF